MSRNNSKRSATPRLSKPDKNNNHVYSTTPKKTPKKVKIVDDNHQETSSSSNPKSYTIGQIKELRMINFMCHKNFAITFEPIPMQIVTGSNGSGKSTIANAICLCLGAQARTTGRTSNVQSFIRHGETAAELTITLSNEGPEAYKPELYGNEIRIVRRIGPNQSSYKIYGNNRKIISTRKEIISDITQALSISPENPLCILHQEVAKTFLLNSDARKKYQFYMKVSQLDQIKQAYEEGVCTVEMIGRRIDVMKQKHADMIREMEPLERQVKIIGIRRDRQKEKHELEAELVLARDAETRQSLTIVQLQLDDMEKGKAGVTAKITEAHEQLRVINQRIENFLEEKADLEKDLLGENGLRELNFRFAKEKKELDLIKYRLTRECEQLYKTLHEIELQQERVQQHINEFQSASQRSNESEQQRVTLEMELHDRQQQQIERDKRMMALAVDAAMNNEKIREKETILNDIQQKSNHKRQEIDELYKAQQNRINLYGTWMLDCLRAIENERAFHQKPIGPIGLHIRCIDPTWSYAVEKHLTQIMSSFICTDKHDERILLGIFDQYVQENRPTIHVRAFRPEVHDISGTLSRVKHANLLSMYQVLKIDNTTVACVLIDHKQIEATILLDDLPHAKRVYHSGVLRWEKMDRKVKQVSEAYTRDGSNIKLDKTFRIYTTDKRPARYFTSIESRSLSLDDLSRHSQTINDESRQIMAATEELKKIQVNIIIETEKLKRDGAENRRKILGLNQELDRLNSTMPVVINSSLDELQQQLNDYTLTHQATQHEFNRVKSESELKQIELAEITPKLENIQKKIEIKMGLIDKINEQISDEQSERYRIEQQLPKLTNKLVTLNEDIRKYQEKASELNKNPLKKPKKTTATIRSVREIEQELETINNFLKAHEDTTEKRRELIDEFKIKRDAANQYKTSYERANEHLKHFDAFVNKRKERFVVIASQHEFLLRHKFGHLMEKYHFAESDITINHKKEELDIIVKKNQRSVASLSGGERSISTFCFLLALWGSIYQPFRLLDEIDIYMDNEKRNSSLQLLYDNTQHYSSSQHVIFTPQAIDSRLWDQLNVPVVRMPTPKRSL